MIKWSETQDQTNLLTARAGRYRVGQWTSAPEPQGWEEHTVSLEVQPLLLARNGSGSVCISSAMLSVNCTGQDPETDEARECIKD